MDSLIEKWKKTTVSSQRYSDQKQRAVQKEPIDSSSSDDEPKKQPFQNSANKQSPNQLKNGTQSIKSVRQSQNSGFKQASQLGSSEKKRQFRPPTFAAALDTCTYHLLQLYKKEQTQAQLAEGIKLQLVDFAETLQTLGSPGYAQAQVEELQQKIHQYENQLQTLKNNSKEEISRKIISELEIKLMDSEKNRVKLKQQKENLQIQIEKIQEQVAKHQIAQELVLQLRSENSVLKKNNDLLTVQVQQMMQKDQDQQNLWSKQVDDLVRMMDILKAQIQSASSQ